MNHAYDEFGQGNQSPYTVGRGAHPGAVLLSPQSSAMNLSNSIASPMVLSPKIGGQSHSMFFNDVVDVQPLPQPAIPPHSSSTTPAAPATTTTAVAAAPSQGSQATQNPHATHNAAAGSAVLSPMVQSPNCNPANLGSTSMFLDSFTRPSSTSMLGVHSKPKQQPQHNQHVQSSQQHHSQQLPASQAATTGTPTGQQLPQTQQPSQHHQQTGVPPPQVPNNSVVNFTQDINQLCSWLSMLSSAQQNTVMDNLLFTLHEDVLQYTKLKLNSLAKSGFISPQIPAIASPVPNRDPYPLVNLDSVFSSDDVENKQNDNSILFQQWSPQPTSVTQPIFDYIKDVHQRPKSADPHVARATGHGVGNNKPRRNLGVGNNSNNNSNNNNNNNNNPHTHIHGYGHSSNNHHFTSKARAAAASGGDRDSSGSAESLSRPASRGNVQNGSVANNAVHNNNNSAGNNNNNSTSNSATPTGTTTTNGSSMNPKTLTDPRLLTNIPVWLKSLRLHKYSDSLKSKRWDELIYLDDETLEKMGISALGARRKLLKAFAVVREYKEQGLIDQSAYM